MSFDHIRDHNFTGFLSQDVGPRANKYGDPKDFTATTIKSTTTLSQRGSPLPLHGAYQFAMLKA